MKPALSGNYIFKVYLDDPSNVAFTWRFSVFEKSNAGITGQINQASNISDRDSRQEVDFTVHFNGMQIPDPDHEINVIITQNDRWDNAINAKPKFMRGDELDFNYDERNTFNGGNEFRAFDTKSLMYQSERIQKLDYDSAGYEVILLDDQKRTTKNYVTDKDLNGRKYIKNEEHAQNSDIEADYTWVHFFIPCYPPIPGGLAYILGALTDWQLNDGSRMTYNSTRKGYEKNLLLKQGYYNYLYVVKDLRTGKADESAIEGNHWETENEYTIWVYFHETGGLYDRLIAVQNINSIR
jgi:hypothetical protein